MNNWTMKQKSNNPLIQSFPRRDVREYLGFDENFPSGNPSRWLLDSFQLLDKKWDNVYGDYSFIIMPASKALEFWIEKLASDLGVQTNSKSANQIRKQIEELLPEILSDTDEKIGEKIILEISYLKLFIQEYRNDIVHCTYKIEGNDLAKNKVFTIFERINSVTEKLLDAKILKRDGGRGGQEKATP